MKRAVHQIVALVATVAVIVGALVAISAPSADKASAASDTSPIKIGYICSCTGALASSVAVAPRAYRAWVSAQNAAGGINGHKIQLIFKDDQTNPGTSMSQLQQLVGQDHVVAIVDISNVDQGWASYLTAQHVPVIGSNISSLLMFSDPNFFAEGQTNDSLPTAVALAAKKVGSKKMALLYCAESPICQQLVAPEKAAIAKAGLQLVYSSSISATSSSFAAECLAAQQAGATTLFIADAVAVVQSVAQSCTKQGYKPQVIADDGAVAQSFLKTPGLSTGMIAMQPNLPFSVTNTPEAQRMLAAFKKYQPGLTSDPNYNEEVVESWASGLLFAQAAKNGGLGLNGAATSQQLYDGLYKMSNVTLNGMAPGLTFKPKQPNPVDCWFWQRTDNGKFTTPYGLNPVCAPQS
jgi:branched-chain amino acid transport system substrate-binding protein